MKENREQHGFTLVEIAIAIVIIGLLVGGILKGSEMISGSRIKAVMKDAATMQVGVESFKERYTALPGDFRDASTRLPGCTATNFCANGNGDHIVGAPTANYATSDQAGTTALPAGETTQLWKHLALYGLLQGVSPVANPSLPRWGETHPACNGCGGYQAVHVRNPPTTPGSPRAGLYVLVRQNTTGNPLPTAQETGAMPPLWAYEIDNKMDDGNANTGFILAPQSGGLCANADGTYNTSENHRNCILLIALDP